MLEHVSGPQEPDRPFGDPYSIERGRKSINLENKDDLFCMSPREVKCIQKKF